MYRRYTRWKYVHISSDETRFVPKSRPTGGGRFDSLRLYDTGGAGVRFLLACQPRIDYLLPVTGLHSLQAPLVRGAGLPKARLRGSSTFLSLPPSFTSQMPPPSSEGGKANNTRYFYIFCAFLFNAKALLNHATIARFSYTTKTERNGAFT